jgi:hypothetical protein
VFAVGLAVVSFLPLYIERTMTHVMFAHGGGGAIEWGWKICTLRSFCLNYHYLRREQNPALWLTVNVALAITYALLAAFFVEIFLARKARRTRSR